MGRLIVLLGLLLGVPWRKGVSHASEALMFGGYSDTFFPSCIRRRRRECRRCSVEARQRRRHADRAAALTETLRYREKKRRGRCELSRDQVAALLRGTPAWPGDGKLSVHRIDLDRPPGLAETKVTSQSR